MKNRMQKLLALLVLLSAINHQLSTAFAQGTAFTYQGQLQNNGALANGTYNLQFSLYTNSTGGTAVAGPVTNSAVAVTNGLFTVTMDFGSGPWNGQTNWLQIGVEANGSNSFTLLSPLQQVTPTPYAISAESAVALASGTAIGMGAANTISGGIADSFIGGGDENTIYALDSVIGGGYFNIIYPNASYSMIGGGYFNLIYPNASYSMIGGGYDNLIEQGNSFIGGGDANTVDQENSFIGSGSQNQNQSFESVIVGGADNVIYPNAQYSAIGGGLINRIYGDTNDYGTSVIAGGYEITINSNSWNSFIGGGGNNTIGTNSDHSVVVGGYANTIQGVSQYATIGGGVGNSVAGFASAVSGGQGNSIQTNAYGSFIGGGAANVIGPDGISGFYTTYSVIGGGYNNTVDEFDSFIGGGQQNVIAGLADHSVIGGGEFNQIIGALTGPAVASVIGGGQGNVIQTNVDFSFIGGGFGNTIQSNTLYAVIPGGSNNVAGGNGSFAAGTSAQAVNSGAFVWSDNSSPSPFTSTAPNQFNVRASGGIQFVPGPGMSLTISNDDDFVPGISVSSTEYSGHMRFRNALEIWPNNANGGYLDVRNTNGTQTIWMSGTNGNITCTTLSQTSDRNAKQDFAPISPSQILDRVVELPVSEWSYKTDSATRHIGPVAQDFHEAFGLNGNDDKHITTVDESGVALAAIQGLNQKLEEQSAENAQLKRENDLLAKRLDELEAEVRSLAQKN